MNKRKKKNTLFQKATSVFLMLTLLWLTVSTPFVITAQQELTKQQKVLSLVTTTQTDCEDCTDEDSSGSNTIEEKVPGGINLAEEFLHDHHITHHFFTVISLYHKAENADSYIAFHGELLVPPPNVA
jgi:hypothetical protein